MKKIYITMGDPRGIGPEIIYKSIKDIFSGSEKKEFTPVIIGDEEILKASSGKYGIKDKISYHPVESSAHPGKDALNYIDKGVDLCKNDPDSALVTAPVEKNIIAQVEKGFAGHTEYIAGLLGVNKAVMAFIGQGIRMSLLTTHIPLKAVAENISGDHIIEHVKIADNALKKWFKIDHPRIVLCGLNPHAGEEGLLGYEEKDCFVPAIKKLREGGININGPLSAEAGLKSILNGEYDLIVSSYHDQLLPGVKALLGPTVNLTAGLPIVRTSPDHGPAIDIAGKKPADFKSMRSAILLAARLIEEK
ncbi:PdxA family protein [Elusimicrobiota bacterium]